MNQTVNYSAVLLHNLHESSLQIVTIKLLVLKYQDHFEKLRVGSLDHDKATHSAHLSNPFNPQIKHKKSILYGMV